MNISYFDFAAKPFEATLVYRVDQKGEIDREAYRAIKEQERIFARMEAEGTDINYEITDKMSLKKYLTQKLSKGEVLGLLKNIAQAAYYVKESGLRPENLLLDVDLVLVDQETGNASLIYLPVEEHDLKIKSLRAFLKEIIVNIVYDEKEDLDYVGRIIANINTNKELSGSDLLELIEGLRVQTRVREEAAAAPAEPAAPAPEEAAPVVEEVTVPGPEEPDIIPVPYLLRDKTGDKIFIEKDEFMIGKIAGIADCLISDNPTVSRMHAIIKKVNGVYYVCDNYSTNSTFLNGERLEPGKDYLLVDKAKIYFANDGFVFYAK
ncbi:MAG: FHA domain-containing protein [Lachnospiraceae bacterium]|nr:FHA domain-containing protein [Lachnospiraceae bacterium]